MNWVNILGGISSMIGVAMGVIGLKSLRSKEHEQAEVGWKQPPLSPWRYETLTMIAITLHTFGLVCLTALVLLSLTGSNLFAGSPNANPSLLLSAIALFAVFFTSYSSAVALAYHFAQPWIHPVSYGISGDGMWYGGSLIGWKSYSYYEVGPDDGMISLYSSYSPPLRTWVIQPPAESFSRILGILQKNLSSTSPAGDSVPWQHSPLILILGMALLITGTLLPAVWGWTQNQSRVWIYALIAFFFVQYFGIKLITLFDGRGQTWNAKTLEDER